MAFPASQVPNSGLGVLAQLEIRKLRIRFGRARRGRMLRTVRCCNFLTSATTQLSMRGLKQSTRADSESDDRDDQALAAGTSDDHGDGAGAASLAARRSQKCSIYVMRPAAQWQQPT